MFFHFVPENQEQESVRSMTSSAAPGNEASPFKCCEEASKDFEPLESSKSEKTEKYNLRQSLAWDNAFFTSEGKILSRLEYLNS